ncbi:hypothetical protein GCM10018782_65580 [Streptomyces griseoaurantiacus]|nr:hypothetical protein GCM10018782_65580 [Streptomyces griseoaurantiacus]
MTSTLNALATRKVSDINAPVTRSATTTLEVTVADFRGHQGCHRPHRQASTSP